MASRRPVAIKKIVFYSDGSADLAIKNLATGRVTHKTRSSRTPAAFSGLRTGEPAELVPDDIVVNPEEVSNYGGPFWRELATNTEAYAAEETKEAKKIHSIIEDPPAGIGFFELRDLELIERKHFIAANGFGTAANVSRRIIEMADNPPDWIATLARHAYSGFVEGRTYAIEAHRLGRAFRFLTDYRAENEPGPDFFEAAHWNINNYAAYTTRIPWLEWTHATAMSVEQKTSEIDLEPV